MSNKSEYVELGLICAEVCGALKRGMNGKELDDLSQSVREGMEQLTLWAKPVIPDFDNSLTIP